MRICILCPADNINEARENAKKFTTSPVLNIPVSKTGVFPATAWFCTMDVDDYSHQLILSLKTTNEQIVEESSPKDFLNKMGLKIIK